VRPIPAHLHTVTPRLVVSDGSAAIEFYARAFGAQEIYERFVGPQGELIHTEIQIGDSIVMLTEESADAGGGAGSPQTLGGASAIMATYWEDVDAAWEAALAAGAEVIFSLADHFYGERGGRLRDPFGHQWMMSQVIEELSRDELVRRVNEIEGSSS
jgi:PhnB protein